MKRLIIDGLPYESIGYSVTEKIRKEQYNLSKKAFDRFDKEYITFRDSACTLIEVRDELIIRGVKESSLMHNVNDFSDRLEITIKEIIYKLDIPLFPKSNARRAIGLTTVNMGLCHNFEITSSPSGIAEFIIALSDWMPEYLSIEELIIGEEKKKNIACDIALDLLKKKFDDILTAKGYQYEINRFGGSNIATLSISIGTALIMSFRIELLDDFLFQLTRIIESLPDNQQEQISMLSLENILYCTMIEDFDENLLESLRKGGYNVIVHEGRIWVPNMHMSTQNDSENVRIYTKHDVLPPYAPTAKLKAINVKLGELVQGLSASEKEEFLHRLVNGVGFAGHYNRHRYKIPTDILNSDDGVL